MFITLFAHGEKIIPVCGYDNIIMCDIAIFQCRSLKVNTVL